MDGATSLSGTMWPETPAELTRLQRELASSRPAPWRPMGARPLIAGCFVCFARGVRGRGRAGERGWAAAALMRGNRQLTETAIARGEAGGPYQPGLLARREGPLLEAALRALRRARREARRARATDEGLAQVAIK